MPPQSRRANRAVSVPQTHYVSQQTNFPSQQVSSIRFGESTTTYTPSGERVYQNRYVQINFAQNNKGSKK